MAVLPTDPFKPGLFTPRTINRLVNSITPIIDQTQASITQSNFGSTSSFKLDPSWPHGIRSTQQLPVNFGKFENHVFFNSAEVKVNIAFDIIKYTK